MPLPRISLTPYALVFFALLLCHHISTAEVPASEFKERRAKLRAKLDGPLVLFGRTSAEEDDSRDGFFQEPNFYYFSGWQEADAVLLLTKSEEILFLPPKNDRFETFYGSKAHASDADIRHRTGFEAVKDTNEFEAQLLQAAGVVGKVYSVPDPVHFPKLKKLVSLRPKLTVEDGASKIAALRMIKSANEIKLIEASAGASMAAHREAFRQIAPGRYEYQIAAAMKNTWEQQGCERPAYPPIVGSGPNSIVLHYSANKRRMDSGDVVVMDVGAECSLYAADITRTVPVSGRFTARQREIYDIVLGAQQAAIQAVKPGVYIGNKEKDGSLMKIAWDYINTHGKDRQGQPLGKYFVHGLSHHVGLDVHDLSDTAQPLAPGMVITIEPGIYIPEENIGIRIEDMVLVTGTGHRVLTEALPKSADQMQNLIRKGEAK